MESIISVKNIRKVYKLGPERVVALDNINLEIYKGQVCCILGTSGSGKSTLLNQLAGLEKPSKGSVVIGKTNISKLSEDGLARFRQKNIGFIFQSYNLLTALTALENVSMPLMFKGIDRRKREKIAAQMLSDVGLAERIHHRPSQMSGGQQQRVGIARAFVSRPKIVFADEPTGNLDSKTTIEVMKMMLNMSRENNQTFILVTHDRELAEYADRIITLIDGNIVSDVANISLIDRTDEQRVQNEIDKAQAQMDIAQELMVNFQKSQENAEIDKQFPPTDVIEDEDEMEASNERDTVDEEDVIPQASINNDNITSKEIEENAQI